MADTEPIHCCIPVSFAGMRLDQALSQLWPCYSRSRIQQWIKSGHLQVNGRSARPRDPVMGGERVQVVIPQEKFINAEPQPIPLKICYEDSALIVIDKPAGLVVHPAAGNRDGTLVNALLHHAPELAGLPRAGLVHRLDKDTSGLLVVARSLPAHRALIEQLKAHTIEREYEAIVNGVMTAGGMVNAPIGRHPMDRKRMAVVARGKSALTHYRVIARFAHHTHVRVLLETGRTHQIRVHMAHIRYPILGDPVYGGRFRVAASLPAHCREALSHFRRQALHAVRLSLLHPLTGARMQWRCQVPPDIKELLELLHDD